MRAEVGVRPHRAGEQERTHARLPVEPVSAPEPSPLGLVLTGGGARAAYQVGVLRWIARRHPQLRVPILTGASAGAINAAHLAAHPGPLQAAVEDLAALWGGLSPEQVFRVDAQSLVRNVGGWGVRLVSGGSHSAPRVRGLVDTTPLRGFLARALEAEDGRIPGIARNLERGVLEAVGISTTSYGSGRTVVWIQGAKGPWQRPQRHAVRCTLSLDHVMASAALPIFFPAVAIGRDWYGDGSVRAAAPLSPALHLGAGRLLAVSTRHRRSGAPGPRRDTRRYPAPAQVVGVLMNSVFLDLVDQDALRLERFNRLLARLPESEREGMRLVELLVVRPSQDLGRLARRYEPRLPRAFRFLSRGLGTREARGADVLSMIMFQADYLTRLMELGEEDAEGRAGEIEAFLAPVLAGGSADVQRARAG